MTIYIIYAIIVLFLFYLQPSKENTINNSAISSANANKSCLIFSIFLLILIMGLRDVSVGVDTKQYRVRFFNSAFINGLDTSMEEYGFPYIGYIFNKLNLSWQVYLFSLNAFMISVLGYFIYKLSPIPWLSIWLFMFIGLFSMYMTGLRQSLAISLCLLALTILLLKKKWWTYLLFVALVYCATTIHTSSFIFFIMLLTVNIRLTRTQAVILFLLSVSVLLYADMLSGYVERILPSRYEDYELLGMNGELYKQNPLVVFVTITQTFFCLFFNRNIDYKTGKYTKLTSVLFIMSCLTIMFNTLGLSNNQIGRIAYYFSNANIVLIPQSIIDIRDRKTRLFATVAIAISSLLYFVISTPGGTTEIDNYLFFWQS